MSAAREWMAMNRTSSVTRFGFRGLALAALLMCAGGCETEDPVARVIGFDAGSSGTLSVGDAGTELEWGSPGEAALPECDAEAVDAGTPCADAGARE